MPPAESSLRFVVRANIREVKRAFKEVMRDVVGIGKASKDSGASAVSSTKKTAVQYDKTAKTVRGLNAEIAKVGVSSKKSAQQAVRAARQLELGFSRAVKGQRDFGFPAAIKSSKELGTAVKATGKAAETAAKKGTSAWGLFNKGIISASSLVSGLVITFGGFQIVNAIRQWAAEVINFESAFANVRTLVDEAKVNVDSLRRGILDLGGSLGSATELTRGLYQTLSAGVQASSAVKFLATSAKFARAALTDTFTAVDVVTTIINAYGRSVEEAGQVTDTLFQVIKEGKTTGPELASSLGRVIATAATLNVSLPEVGAALATMTKGGVNTRESVTALNQALFTFLKPTSQAIQLAKQMGVELSATRIETEGFANVLADLAKKTEGNKRATATFFGNIRALKAVLTLTGSQAEEYVRIQEVMGNSIGVVNEAFEKQSNTLAFQASALWVNFQKLLVSTSNDIGFLTQRLKNLNTALEDQEVGVSVLGDVLIYLKDLASFLQRFKTEVLAVGLVAAAVAIGVLFVKAGSLVGGVVALKAVFAGLGAYLGGGLLVVFAKVIAVIVAVGLAIAALERSTDWLFSTGFGQWLFGLEDIEGAEAELANQILKTNAAMNERGRALIASGELSKGESEEAKRLLNHLVHLGEAWKEQKISLEEFSQKSQVAIDNLAALRHEGVAASEKVKEFKEEIDALVDQFIAASNADYVFVQALKELSGDLGYSTTEIVRKLGSEILTVARNMKIGGEEIPKFFQKFIDEAERMARAAEVSGGVDVLLGQLDAVDVQVESFLKAVGQLSSTEQLEVAFATWGKSAQALARKLEVLPGKVIPDVIDAFRRSQDALEHGLNVEKALGKSDKALRHLSVLSRDAALALRDTVAVQFLATGRATDMADAYALATRFVKDFDKIVKKNNESMRDSSENLDDVRKGLSVFIGSLEDGTGEFLKIDEALSRFGVTAEKDISGLEKLAKKLSVAFEKTGGGFREMARVNLSLLNQYIEQGKGLGDEQEGLLKRLVFDTDFYIRGEARQVWKDYYAFIMQAGGEVPPELHQINAQILIDARRSSRDLSDIWKRQISTIVNDFSKGVSDMVFAGGNFFDLLGGIFEEGTKGLMRIWLENFFGPLVEEFSFQTSFINEWLGGLGKTFSQFLFGKAKGFAGGSTGAPIDLVGGLAGSAGRLSGFVGGGAAAAAPAVGAAGTGAGTAVGVAGAGAGVGAGATGGIFGAGGFFGAGGAAAGGISAVGGAVQSLLPFLAGISSLAIGAVTLGFGAAIPFLVKMFTQSPFEAATKEASRDFGLSLSQSTIAGFIQGIGLGENQFKGIRKDILSSPKFLEEIGIPQARADGTLDQLIASYARFETSWGTFDLSGPLREAVETGDFEAYNEAWEKVFKSSAELRRQLGPDWLKILSGTNLAVERANEVLGKLSDRFNLTSGEVRSLALDWAILHGRVAEGTQALDDLQLVAFADDFAESIDLLAQWVEGTERARDATKLTVVELSAYHEELISLGKELGVADRHMDAFVSGQVKGAQHVKGLGRGAAELLGEITGLRTALGGYGTVRLGPKSQSLGIDGRSCY